MNICTVQARNVEYVDPQDKEWEEFQKMIQEETKVSCWDPFILNFCMMQTDGVEHFGQVILHYILRFDWNKINFQ